MVDDFYDRMKKEQELLDLSYKESVRQKRKRKEKDKTKKQKTWEDYMPFYSQWYWMHDWLGKKCKAWYHGPRVDWMFLEKWEKKQKDKEKKKKLNTLKKDMYEQENDWHEKNIK